MLILELLEGLLHNKAKKISKNVTNNQNMNRKIHEWMQY